MSIDRVALEQTLQNGSELLNPVFKDGKILDMKIDYIEPIVDVDIKTLKDLMQDAVYDSMEKHAGKKIGIMLSGGTDSTYLLTMLTNLFSEYDITGYHTYFKDPTRDERDFARLAAKDNAIPLKIIDMGPLRQAGLVAECVKRCNVVMSAIVYSYGIAKEMAADGIEVVVNAVGLDELFGAFSIDKRYYNRRKLYPFTRNITKYGRELAKRYGTDRAFLVNNIAIEPGKQHIKMEGHPHKRYYISQYFDEIWEGNLWSTIKRYLFERNCGGHYRLYRQPVDVFNMEIEFPFINRDLVEYCFSCKPEDVYNKRPLRELMRDLEIPEVITSRGEDWSVDNKNKIGWCPSPQYYIKFTQKFFPDKTRDLSDYITNYTARKLSEWIKTGDRRAQQIGLFAGMLME